jgi:hypothetical protein
VSRRRVGAALGALLTACAALSRAATPPKTGVLGTVLTAEVASDPFADNVSGAGSMVIVDKDGNTADYSVIGTTRLTRDGKKIAFDTALIGDLVVRAEFDPNTKTLNVLDLLSPGAAAPAKKEAHPAATGKSSAPATVKGEVAFADTLKGTLSVRTGKGRTREFAVVETTAVLRETADGPAREIGFETVSIGDAVEVRSRDGKTADQIRIRPAAR